MRCEWGGVLKPTKQLLLESVLLAIYEIAWGGHKHDVYFTSDDVLRRMCANCGGLGINHPGIANIILKLTWHGLVEVFDVKYHRDGRVRQYVFRIPRDSPMMRLIKSSKTREEFIEKMKEILEKGENP
ncbi:hypothetical protein [Vulcanisaeta distributa]|uniref:hypothetical protein n=1 Tax=Vulcanisaeta distributa TaxID=164451 RepID=UPI0006D16BBF|nr:hypothetical protein [Vulcanisaeta distributa]